MRYTLENEILSVAIDSFGAEVKSVKRKDNQMEYMWQADPAYWGRTSPVLFPFVGVPKNKEYRYEGKTYAMGQHGFARDMEFELESIGENSIWFVLESTEETYAKYPFAFRLHIGYELEDNRLEVKWKVENTDNKMMYFSIGAHPAFRCPIHGEETKLGYGLKFGGLSTELHHHGNTPAGLAVMQEEVLPLENGSVRFTPGFFDKCTYMVEGKQTGQVSLLDAAGAAYVNVEFDTPLFAVWSPEGKEAPFVCIEPWYGRCDAEDFEGELQERDYENALKAGERFEAAYRICFSGDSINAIRQE
jgi:galactose mutarotase-like enzyme